MAEPTTGVRFAGVLRDGSGNLITSGVTANSYNIGTTTPTRGTEDSTFTSGKFGISDSGFGRFDVKIVNGSEQIWWSSLAEVQVTSLQARNPTTASAALEVFSTTSEASSLVAVFGFRPSTESSGVETADTPSDGDRGYINFELSNDATSKEQWVAGRLEWEGVDVSNGSEDGQLNLWAMTAGTLVEELHLSGAALWPEADAGLDLGTTALGFNDLHLGSGGIINLDGGDVTLTHSSGTLTYGGDGAVSVAFGANVDLQFTGGTGTNEIVLANGLADALSITDGSADVIAISTAGGTNTVAITGDLTVSGTIAADTAAVATTVTITDNEDTDEANAIIFTSGGDVDGGNIGLESDGTLNYNPSTGTLTSTVFAGNLSGTVSTGTQGSITAAANLVTVGTIGSGTWQGTAIASAYIAADAITGAKIADNAIDSEHYTDGSIDNAHIADDAIDSEHYAAGSIDTAHIADDQVTLAKMAGLTRGSMIIGDSSGNPSALVKGSANYVLTSDGTDIAWAAAAGSNAHDGDTTIADGSGLIVGHSAFDTTMWAAYATPEFQVLGTAADSGIGAVRYSADAFGPMIGMGKSRHADLAGNTIVADNDILGKLIWFGADGNAAATIGAEVFARVNGTPGNGDMPTELVFATTADGASAATERLLIDAAGDVGIGIATPDSNLHIHNATAGTIASASNTVLTVENNNSAIIQILTPAANVASINFGSPTSNERGVFQYNHNTDFMHWNVGAATRMSLDSGTLYIGDTANTKMTQGLTINQAATDNEAFALKSSDVDHPMTDLAETDTFLAITKYTGADGGSNYIGYTDASVAHSNWGRAATEITTDTSSSEGNIMFSAQKSDAATAGDVGTTANAFVIRNSVTSRAIFKGNGDLHITNTTLTALDDYPDALMARAGRAELAPAGSFLNDRFAGIVDGGKAFLADNKIMWADEGGEAPFMAIQKSVMLGWDMAFQNASWIADIVSVLSDTQRAKLPTKTRDMLALMPAGE